MLEVEGTVVPARFGALAIATVLPVLKSILREVRISKAPRADLDHAPEFTTGRATRGPGRA